MNPQALERYETELAAYAATSRPLLQSVLILHRGALITEHYWRGLGASSYQPLYSITKSVVSALVGMALADGKLRLDDTLAQCFPELPVEPRAQAAAVTIRHLLTMSSGFEQESPSRDAADPVIALLGRRPAHAPGQRFRYSNDDIDLLAVILERALGEAAIDYAQRRLFTPLGIWREVPKSNRRRLWKTDRQGRIKGSHGLHLTARELASFGQFYLQAGCWQGQALLPPEYISASTTAQIAGGYPEQLPYGYLWWVSTDREGRPAFFASGAGGQYLCVFPGRELVIAITSTLKNISGRPHRVMITRLANQLVDAISA